MPSDNVKVTVAPSYIATTAAGSGYYINLGDGRGYIPCDLWINTLPGSEPVTPPPVTPTQPVGTARAKIGVYKNYQNIGNNPDGTNPAGIQPYNSTVVGYEAFLGRKVDYVLEFQATNNSDDHLAFPGYMSGYYTKARMGTRLLMTGAGLSSPFMPDGWTRKYSWQQMADGVMDTPWANWAIRMKANQLEASGNRGAHEFNLELFAHRVYPGEEAAFIAAWRRWHGILRANGFTGKFHWNPVSGDYRRVDAANCYPGDAYVDVIDLDMYDEWYSRGTKPGSTAPAGTADGPRSLEEQKANWNRQVNGWHGDANSRRGLAYWRAFAVSHGKGMGFSEWGMGEYFNMDDGNHGGGDNEWYVERMADFIQDPAYPPGSPGGVVDHAFWEHDPGNGVQPNSAANPDSARAIPVPKARAAFLRRFGGA